MKTPITDRDKRAEARSTEKESQMKISSKETAQEKIEEKRRKEKRSKSQNDRPQKKKAAKQSIKLDKKRKRSGDEKEVQTAKKQRNPTIRCNLHKLVGYIVGKLSEIPERYMEAVMKTPFGNLFNVICNGQLLHEHTALSPRAFLTIMSGYDSKKQQFNLGGKKIELRDDDFALIFGLPKKGLGLKLKAEPGKKYIPGAFTTRTFPGVDFITRKVIENAIDKLLSDEVLKGKERNINEDSEDFARLMILYMVVTVFLANANQNVGFQFVDNLEVFDDISNMKWASIFHRDLMEKLSRHHANPLHTPGAVIAVNYWFCEHTNIETPSSNCVSPRLVWWNITNLLDGVDDNQMQKICEEKGVNEQILRISDEEKLLLGEAIDSTIQHETDEVVAAKNLQHFTDNVEIPTSDTGIFQEVANLGKESETEVLHDEIADLKKVLFQEKENNLKLLEEKEKELEEKEKELQELKNQNEQLKAKVNSLSLLNELKNLEDQIEIIPFSPEANDERQYMEFEFAKPPELKEKEIQEGGSTKKCGSMVLRLKTKSRKIIKRNEDYIYYTTKKKKGAVKQIPTVEPTKVVQQNAPSFEMGIESQIYEYGSFIPPPPKLPFPPFDKTFLQTYLSKKQMEFADLYFNNAEKDDLTFNSPTWEGALITSGAFHEMVSNTEIDQSILWWYCLYLARRPLRTCRKTLIINPQLTIEQKESHLSVAIPNISETIQDMQQDVDLVLVPINSGEDAVKLKGYHWTLLAIHLVSYQATHYNSLTTSSGHYLEEAIAMTHIITHQLSKRIKLTRTKMQKLNNVITGYCPQQGTYPDCAVYVCEFMERLMDKRHVMARSFTPIEAQRKRAEMVYLILSTPGAWDYKQHIAKLKCEAEAKNIQEQLERD